MLRGKENREDQDDVTLPSGLRTEEKQSTKQQKAFLASAETSSFISFY